MNEEIGPAVGTGDSRDVPNEDSKSWEDGSVGDGEGVDDRERAILNTEDEEPLEKLD